MGEQWEDSSKLKPLSAEKLAGVFFCKNAVPGFSFLKKIKQTGWHEANDETKNQF
jgi:hypothetical protein